jgi:hypothetical protein
MLDDSLFVEAWARAGTTPAAKEFKSAFLGDNSSIYKNFMSEDLKKSGLKALHVNGIVPDMVPQGCDAAYIIPYCGLDGQILQHMHRTRLRRPEHSKESRYTQPSGEYLNKHGLPSYIPYIHPLTLELDSEVMICAEGEKKTVSIIKHLGRPAFGIGGCQMWRNPDGSGSIHPWIKRILESRGCKKVLIVPDGDLFKYDICNAYGTFAHALREAGIDVEMLNPPDKIDDLLVNWEDPSSSFTTLPRAKLEDLVQSASYLARRYNLAFRQNDKGAVTVHQTSSNVMKLLEEHQAFPKIWRNLDTNRVHIGEDPAVPDLTEMHIANYFQHNLGFEKINHRAVFSCIQALAKQNQKSPFLDWIKNLHWDGESRLDTWLSEYWGVENTPFVQEVSKKWMVSACARMDKPGTKVDWMLIIVGPQGTGKTSMPAVIFNGNSLTLYGDSNDKDLHMKIHSALVIGFDELDSFGKRESSFLKAMITTSQDHFRPPYGASVEVFDRRCTLYGCGNRHEFLQSDPSGYRRYAIVEVSRKLDFAALEACRDQLWAEAWHTYQSGCDFWEITNASAEAEKHVAPNEMKDYLINYIDALRKSPLYHKNGLMYAQYSSIIQSLGYRPNSRDVAALLRELGGEKKSSDRGPQGGSPRDWWVFPIEVS